MSPVRNELHEEIAALRDLALSAGELIGTARDSLRAAGFAVDFKSSVDMVTDVDRRVEEHLVAGLERLFPDDAVVAEEGSNRTGPSGRTWLVDPLDGTTNFVHGHPYHAVSLACVDADGPLLAAVHAPELDELWTAVRGGGARLERPRQGRSRDLPSRVPTTLDQALLATGFPYARGEACALNCDAVKTVLLHPCHGVRRAGSAALDLCHVGGGRLDGYWELSLRPWDLAGGSLVALEAGAIVTDLHGGDDWLDGRHVLAAAPGLHAELRPMLVEVLADVL